jgi:WD40 repeat protein
MREALELLPPGEPKWRRYFERGLAAWESCAIRPVASLVHSAVVTAATASPDGRYVLFGDNHGATHLWSLRDNTVRSLAGGEPTGRVKVVAFDRRGRLCASGGEDHLASVWDVETGEKVAEFPLDGKDLYSLAFLGSEGCLVTGSGNVDAPVRLWDVAPARAPLVSVATGRLGVVSRMVASADGNVFVTIKPYGVGALWDAHSGARIADFTGKLGLSVTAAAFSPDGATLALAGQELVLCDARSGAIRQKVDAGWWQQVDDLAFGRDGGLNLVIRNGAESMIRRLSPGMGAWDDFPASALGASIQLVAGGERLLSGFETNSVRLWDLPALSVQPIDRDADVGFVRLAVSRDATRIATLTRPKRRDDHPTRREHRPLTKDELEHFHQSVLRTCDRRGYRPVSRRVELPSGLVPNVLALSPSGDAIAVGCDSTSTQDRHSAPVLLGSTSSEEPIAFRVLGSLGLDIQAIAFTADGQRVIASSAMRPPEIAAELACWNCSGGCRWKLPCRSDLSAIAMAARGGLAAVGTDAGSVHLVSTDRAELGPSAFDAGELIRGLAFSQNGEQLAVATRSGRVTVLRVDGMRLHPEAELDHAGGFLVSLAFSPNDGILFCGVTNRDRNVYCWDAGTWRLIGPIVSFRERIDDFGLAVAAALPAVVAVTPQGRIVMKALPSGE